MNNPHEAAQALYNYATLGAERAASLVSQRLAEADQLEAEVKALREQVAKKRPKPAKPNRR